MVFNVFFQTSVKWTRGVMVPDERHWWIVQPRPRKGVGSRVNLYDLSFKSVLINNENLSV